VHDNTPMAKPPPRLSPEELERVIATAWDDKPPFNLVLMKHGIGHGALVQLLKRTMTPNAFKVWTARTKGSKGPAPAPRKPPRK
jgi:uncharacterized protein (TIGR03643 family)